MGKLKIATLCRQRYADVIRGLYARFSLTLEPDARFQFAQPFNPLAPVHSNEVAGLVIATVAFGRRDDPLTFARQIAKEDALRPPQLENGCTNVLIQIPEGVFVVKILATGRQ